MFSKNWNEPVFVVETWKKLIKNISNVFQKVKKNIFKKLYRDRPISASGPLSLLHVFHFPCSNNPCKYFDPNHRSKRKRGKKNKQAWYIGPHFPYWKANLGSWITWYITENETNISAEGQITIMSRKFESIAYCYGQEIQTFCSGLLYFFLSLIELSNKKVCDSNIYHKLIVYHKYMYV